MHGDRDSRSGAPWITRGPVGRAVIRLAWPVLLAEAIHTLFHIIDIAWVGRLGAWATAAVSSSMFALWTLLSLASLIAVGLTAQVSRAIGGNRRDRAASATGQAVLFALALGAAVAVAGVLLSGWLFRFIGAGVEVAEAGASYLAIYSIAAPMTFLVAVLSAAMRASGDTRTPMWITGASLGANALLDPLLIYGWGPFPRWEVAGAAVATVICQTGAALALAALALRGHPMLPFDRRALARPDFSVMAAQARVGVPYSLIGMLFSINYVLFAAIAARFGDDAIAVIGISNRLESITYLGADAFAIAAATLVGQNLGAGRPDRAEKGSWVAIGWMVAAAAGLTVAFLAAPGVLFRIFTAEAGVLDLGAGYLRILAICQVGSAAEGVIGGVFAGAGNTTPPMLIHALFGILRPPLAYWMATATGWGLMGIALTITGTCLVRAALLSLLFLRGRWKTHRLPETTPPPLPSEEAPDLAI